MKHHVEPLLPLCQCSPTSKFGSVQCDDTIYNNEFSLVLFYRFTKVLYYHLEMACVVNFTDVYLSEDFIGFKDSPMLCYLKNSLRPERVLFVYKNHVATETLPV